MKFTNPSKSISPRFHTYYRNVGDTRIDCKCREVFCAYLTLDALGRKNKSTKLDEDLF